MAHIVIIGNGIAGITTARNLRKISDVKITIISEETPYFYSRTALMYVYMGHLKLEHTQPYENDFWQKNKLDLLQDSVIGIDIKTKKLHLKNTPNITYDKLVIATGSKPNTFNWPGQNSNGVSGLYHKQDLDLLEKYSKDTKQAVIVGGGLIGIELAEMFLSRNIHVTFLVRESSFWNKVLPKQESALINKHILEHHIDLRLNTSLQEIVADNSQRVTHIITDKNEKIPCQMVGLTAGVSPNIAFLKDSGIACDKGVLVDRYLQTNIKDVYALGDCAQQKNPIGMRRDIEALWYTGKIMGEALAQTLAGNPTAYTPGHWFNAAKFLDIEYQTYGWVWAEQKENEADFYWEHKSGKKCIRIRYDKNTKVFIGINAFGIRIRHQVCNDWLEEKKEISHVLTHFSDANFDPEFYKTHEKEIIAQFNIENATNIKPKKRHWMRIFSK